MTALRAWCPQSKEECMSRHAAHTGIAAIGTAARPAARGSSHDRIYREIYDAIVEQRLAPGVTLPEDTLGQLFGVSRTVVRKALLQLGHEQLVEIRPNRGAAVARPTVEEARQVFEARRVVEEGIVRLFMANRPPAGLKALKAMVADEREAHRTHDRRVAIRLAGDFHLAMADHAGNEVLAGYLRALISRTSLIVALYQSRVATLCSFEEHEALIAAIEDGDAERVVRDMEAHLRHLEAGLDLADRRKPVDLAQVFGRSLPGEP